MTTRDIIQHLFSDENRGEYAIVRAMGQRASLGVLIKSEKIRFGVVGAINTVVDFVVLLLLAIVFGVPAVFANVVSTSCAMTVSFVLNKRSVFKNTDKNNRKQVVRFLLVTVSGIWVVQSILIVFLNASFEIIFPAAEEALLLFAAKGIATIASLCWNYIGYKRFVFRKSES